MKRRITFLFIACLVLLVPACRVQDLGSPGDDDEMYNQLKADIAVIENVELENLKEFYEENKDWLADVNSRLNSYIANVPESQQRSVLIELRDDMPATRGIYDYFTSHTYHMRGGYWTYSMKPKMSTRLLSTYCRAGWRELSSIYYYIRTDTGSLSNQYWCHFDAFIESGWDIERGRPHVSYFNTLLALCNP